MSPHDTPLRIGSLLFENLDQIDLTGPFEVLSRIPNTTYRISAKSMAPVRDVNGLWLTPDAVLADAPPLNVLHVPGGHRQEALMDDGEVLKWIRQQASGARYCRYSRGRRQSSIWREPRVHWRTRQRQRLKIVHSTNPSRESNSHGNVSRSHDRRRP
jgi:hypothetical protein